MPDAENDLRATAEAVQHDAERLVDLESRKRSLDPADPEVDRLSRQIEDIAHGLAHKTTAQRELSAEIEGPESPQAGEGG